MSRDAPEARRHRFDSPAQSIVPLPNATSNRQPEGAVTAADWELWSFRGALLAIVTGASYFLAPFDSEGVKAALFGVVVGLAIIGVELRLRRLPPARLRGAGLGATVGLAGAFVLTLAISRTSAGESAKSFLGLLSLIVFLYFGIVIGYLQGSHTRAPAAQIAGTLDLETTSLKLLDTSVLIDGRIADICDTHFLDGPLAVPQFVLHELQLVADSSDMLKRQRGRRGLEVLQRLQKLPHVEVQILSEEPSQGSDVDHKLVELAKRRNAKIVTNDFNLNKVASLQGISILNVNELANALKPAVLPGEPMRVLILREGKESNQGVAYLDDGTMVVVDGARRLINKTVDVIVTSVHQTTAGKMIFGRLDERNASTGSSTKSSASVIPAGRPENTSSE
jgi:uncharacterized protein YacL